MELPPHLKELYKHWEFHTVQPDDIQIETSSITKDIPLLQNIEWFIHERISVWEKKSAGAPLPYTVDPILATYRFCNIFREFDKQTIEFHTLLKPLENDFALWLLNMFYFRMVASTATVQTVGMLSYDKAEQDIFYRSLMDSPRPRFGSAYVFPISTIQRSETPTRELFISYYLATKIKIIAAEISTWNKLSVYEALQKIIPLFGFNHFFLWTEVLIDTAYQFPEYIDLFKQFPIGPGSTPTMKRINAEQDPTILVAELSLLPLDTSITFDGKALRLSAENWEGIGCEYRKYTNLKNGAGRHRLYK